MTLASFQSLGRDPSCGDLLKILHEEGAITEAVSLSHLAGISSGPVALLASSVLKKTVKQVSSLTLEAFCDWSAKSLGQLHGDMAWDGMRFRVKLQNCP